MTQITRRKRRKVQAAAKLYEDFTGDVPQYIEKVYVDVPEVVWLLGELDAVLYTCIRDGKTEHYKHTFKKSSRPLLCSNETGSAIFCVGGRYRITDRGIEDK
jgi:hypothetical protein